MQLERIMLNAKALDEQLDDPSNDSGIVLQKGWDRNHSYSEENIRYLSHVGLASIWRLGGLSKIL